MSFPQFLFSSTSPTKDTQTASVGASSAEPIRDHFDYHQYILKWIHETKHKLPHATPSLRREAFEADPLIKGTIYPYLKNVLLHGFTIQTEDNKLYSEAIKEITNYLNILELMQVFREDFLNFMILDGHSYRRMDPDLDGNITRLEKIDPSSVSVYNDPWDSSVIAYHQRALVKSTWSRLGTTEQVDSWFIPFGERDIYSTYIEKREQGNDQTVKDIFDLYKEKYNITDITNLRIASSERVIAMHNTERLQAAQSYYDDHETENDTPAPIDSVLLAIWLKRLLLVNAPNLLYVVLSPFLHSKSGILKEGKDPMGNPTLISSIPQKPSSALQLSNPDLYNNMLANFNTWVEDIKAAQKNIMECLKNSGVFSSGPDFEIKPVESTRTVSDTFIKGIIDMLDEEIGLALGFPISLIKASGTELASSRNILQNFNNVHKGEITEYETVANRLIRKMFEGRTWTGTTTIKGEDGESKEVQVTYSFEDMTAHFVLDTPDTKDLLQESQTFKTYSETLVQIKSIGATKDDLQALGEEWGFGLLALDGAEMGDADLLEWRNNEVLDDDEIRTRRKFPAKTQPVSE
jgi:hypothetical protein